jgi:predicted nucleic acid-binding protein
MGQVASDARIYLDANILIRMTEGPEEDRRGVSEALATYVANGADFITSELSFTEVLVHPIRFQRPDLIARYTELLSKFVEPQPVSREVLLTAARLRADMPALRTPDAIHAATAILAHASEFLTGDRGIKARPGALNVVYV